MCNSSLIGRDSRDIVDEVDKLEEVYIYHIKIMKWFKKTTMKVFLQHKILSSSVRKSRFLHNRTSDRPETSL